MAATTGGQTNSGHQQQVSGARSASRQPLAGASGQQGHHPAGCVQIGPSSAFQQVKQTQASLARLSRIQQQQQQQQLATSQTNQSSQQVKDSSQQVAVTKSTTFVDCLIRRFKDCFNEDACTVPMFVVGNLSPGSDGTHLILPPCVSLGRQNISRFASLKNLRLINSIRESCRSIEELDLGGNKLTDLIEVYKILQCTPNLKFLNLSENDLSRTSPVAMATSCVPTVINTPPIGALGGSAISHAGSTQQQQQQQAWSMAQVNSQRACLAPINQNQLQAIGGRRHSTLGQSGGIGQQAALSRRPRSGPTQVAESRRLAAAAAVAQSKKTSPSVASKLTNSARVATSCRTLAPIASQAINDGQANSSSRVSEKSSQRVHQTKVQASTMHLARSLSSLSAKDVRGTGSSLTRSSTLRSGVRKESNLRVASCQQKATRIAARITTATSTTTTTTVSSSVANDDRAKQQVAVGGKQIVEPIDEADDVEMAGEQSLLSQQRQVSANQSSKSLAQQSGALTKTASSNSTLSNCQQSSGGHQFPNYRRTFESIKALALNNTSCQWRVVCSILSRMPNLEELHLSLNNYERIDLDPNEFKHVSLKRLYLCNNPKLTNWEELDKLLIAFPSLQALSIADCNISQIPDNLDRAREWRKLCGLNINGWPIKEWPVIERLNQLPSLIDLKCRNLEILNTIDEPRHHLIARLPKLQRLNGSEIEEREHAEKAFLRFFMTNAHLERPPRFHELVQIHGEVMPVDVDVDLSPPSQAHVRVIYLNRNHYRNEEDTLMSEDFLIKLMDNVDDPNNVLQQQQSGLEGSIDMATDQINAPNLNDNEVDSDNSKPVRLFKDDGQEVLAFEVDLRQSVRKFKSTLASLFGLRSQNLILYYIDHEMVGLMGPELIKHNQKKLWNYNVQDGDQFIVEER